MRAADRRGLLRAPVTVALQTAITQKEKRENALSGLPSTTRAVRRRASRAGSPPSYAEVRDFAQWVWTREVVVGEKGQAKPGAHHQGLVLVLRLPPGISAPRALDGSPPRVGRRHPASST